MKIHELLQSTEDTLLIVRSRDLKEFADKLLANKESPSNPEQEKPLSQSEAIKFLGKTRQTFVNWRKKGLVNAYTINGKLYYKKSELLDALQKAD